ncbi:MAG TPA: acyloxyacyl hydrolase, partial [Acidobacteriota bacterium]|nr:acyloxyacyl hydrolase [Acidobacteriota bacterium]
WSGVRYKRVISDVAGKGFWRGSLEYGVEFMPVFLVFQGDDVIYGTEVSPLLMRWNFQKSGAHILPFFEWGGGLLFTTEQVPVRSSNFNFTPQAGFGLSIFNSNGGAMTFQLKYMHISNGGLKKPNPGINSIQVLAGYEWLY